MENIWEVFFKRLNFKRLKTSIKSFSESKKQTANSHCAACYIVFPEKFAGMGNFLEQHISCKLYVTCRCYEYKDITKKQLQSIDEQLQKPCIFILIFSEALSYENYYKLGIAHAHRSHVILLNLCKMHPQNFQVPQYLRYNFLVHSCFTRDDKRSFDLFLKKLEKTLSVIVSGDIIEILYQKSLEICETIEKNHQISLKKRGKRIFREKVKQMIQRRTKEEVFQMYLDDDTEFYSKLLQIIIAREDLHKVFGIPLEISHNEEMNNEDFVDCPKSGMTNMSESKYTIKANNVLIAETTAGGDAVIHKVD